MQKSLPTPDIVGRSIEEGFHHSTPALSLRWPATAAAEKLWELPEGVSIVGAPPERLGFHVQRLGRDTYSLRLMWNQMSLTWETLSRMQLLSSALAPLLASLGTDLWCLLEQPVNGGKTLSRTA
jgi:hypothetical protein